MKRVETPLSSTDTPAMGDLDERKTKLAEEVQRINQMSVSELFRCALRRDVETFYAEAGECAIDDTPALRVLTMWVSINQPDAGPFDVLEWAIGRMGKGAAASAGAKALLGLGEMRGKSQMKRWRQAATAMGYKNADSFRNSKRKGRRIIDTVMDEVARELVALAEQWKIIESRQLEEVRRLMDGTAVFPVVVPFSSGAVLARNVSEAYIGDMLTDVPFIPREDDD